eukprot:TRINITY_DN14797_c0_g1_i2.p1 TRINITY_DN14797_c0_g1~~TRINITY_DN14797_c0_g1_i2.p1  ORF type:complete len:624 (+),score=132.75 TRINITY_DN14797_c0_g1_i2:857-2728(+)
MSRPCSTQASSAGGSTKRKVRRCRRSRCKGGTALRRGRQPLCDNCRRLDSVCSQCFVKHRKAAGRRRRLLKENCADWPLRRRVGVFFAACVAGDDEDVAAMLETGSCDPNWRAAFVPLPVGGSSLPRGGIVCTPMHVAAAHHHPDVVAALAAKGGRSSTDSAGNKPVDYVGDDDARHDIQMYLDELAGEGAPPLPVGVGAVALAGFPDPNPILRPLGDTASVASEALTIDPNAEPAPAVCQTPSQALPMPELRRPSTEAPPPPTELRPPPADRGRKGSQRGGGRGVAGTVSLLDPEWQFDQPDGGRRLSAGEPRPLQQRQPVQHVPDPAVELGKLRDEVGLLQKQLQDADRGSAQRVTELLRSLEPSLDTTLPAAAAGPLCAAHGLPQGRCALCAALAPPSELFTDEIDELRRRLDAARRRSMSDPPIPAGPTQPMRKPSDAPPLPPPPVDMPRRRPPAQVSPPRPAPATADAVVQFDGDVRVDPLDGGLWRADVVQPSERIRSAAAAAPLLQLRLHIKPPPEQRRGWCPRDRRRRKARHRSRERDQSPSPIWRVWGEEIAAPLPAADALWAVWSGHGPAADPPSTFDADYHTESAHQEALQRHRMRQQARSVHGAAEHAAWR